ncbi:hypothetical protein SSX86_007368 [Deinandra increscens subsp. villosa]|uniref:BAG domain-containing protein n=1 Tax=Deinandra increscens subsp. villosa TaxID=3103831 RepID=A0AAP0DDE0_9ASTR
MEQHGGDAAASSATNAAATSDNQLEDGGAGSIKVKVSFASNNFDVSITPQSTFGDLKQVIAKATGLDPEVQNVLFRGKENEDHESLQMAGVKDNAKMILIENSPTKNEDLEKVDSVEEINENIEEISRGLEAVNQVREETNQFAEQVVSLEAVVCSGTQVADKDFIFLTEMLMRQLLKLDGIDVEGKGRVQRKMEVRRVQALVEKLDSLRAKNSNPTSDVQEKADEPSSPSSKVNQE